VAVGCVVTVTCDVPVDVDWVGVVDVVGLRVVAVVPVVPVVTTDGVVDLVVVGGAAGFFFFGAVALPGGPYGLPAELS